MNVLEFSKAAGSASREQPIPTSYPYIFLPPLLFVNFWIKLKTTWPTWG